MSAPDAAKQLLEALARPRPALHLVLKWQPSIRAETIDLHREVADAKGAVWWGRVSKPGVTGLADHWVQRLLDQTENDIRTYVFLTSSAGGTWRAELLDVSTDETDVEKDLVPSYYDPATHHSLWVKLTNFDEVSEEHILNDYVKAADGEAVGIGALHNQTPVILKDKLSAPSEKAVKRRRFRSARSKHAPPQRTCNYRTASTTRSGPHWSPASTSSSPAHQVPRRRLSPCSLLMRGGPPLAATDTC